MREILLTRDSVSPREHDAAQHAKIITVSPELSIKKIISQVYNSGYLNTKRKRVTWSVESGDILAVLSQKLDAPLFLPASNADVAKLRVDEGVSALHFYCLGSVPPLELFDMLERNPYVAHRKVKMARVTVGCLEVNNQDKNIVIGGMILCILFMVILRMLGKIF